MPPAIQIIIALLVCCFGLLIFTVVYISTIDAKKERLKTKRIVPLENEIIPNTELDVSDKATTAVYTNRLIILAREPDQQRR